MNTDPINVKCLHCGLIQGEYDILESAYSCKHEYGTTDELNDTKYEDFELSFENSLIIDIPDRNIESSYYVGNEINSPASLHMK